MTEILQAQIIYFPLIPFLVKMFGKGWAGIFLHFVVMQMWNRHRNTQAGCWTFVGSRIISIYRSCNDCGMSGRKSSVCLSTLKSGLVRSNEWACLYFVWKIFIANQLTFDQGFSVSLRYNLLCTQEDLKKRIKIWKRKATVWVPYLFPTHC